MKCQVIFETFIPQVPTEYLKVSISRNKANIFEGFVTILYTQPPYV